MSKRDPDVLEI